MSKNTQKYLPIFVLANTRKQTLLLDALMPVALVPTTIARGDNNKSIYVGIDIISGGSVYWDLSQSFSPHILVIGPSGSGKTITLLSLANRLRTKYRCSLAIMDVKDEYRYVIGMFKYNDVAMLSLPENPIPLCYCDDPMDKKHRMVLDAVDVVSKIFSLTPTTSRALYDAMFSICTQCIDIDNLLSSDLNVYDRGLNDAIEAVVRIFDVYPSRYIAEAPSLSDQGRVYIVNLRHLFIKSKADSATVILYLTRSLLNQLSTISTLPRVILVLDELWHAVPYIAEDLLNTLTRYGRGIGLMLMMATQNIDDLYPHTNAIVNSCGVFIAMASPSISYWQKLRHYLNLSGKAVEYAATLRNQGEAVARFSSHGVPVFLYVDPFDED